LSISFYVTEQTEKRKSHHRGHGGKNRFLDADFRRLTGYKTDEDTEKALKEKQI
jgi:hypothetical protein